MSGRQTVMDTYGGLIPQGIFSLSGKSPQQIARAGTYMARYVARYLVEQGLVDMAMINLAYVQGQAEPVFIEARGLGKKSRGAKVDLSGIIRQQFDWRPEAIVERLKLKQPIYQYLSNYGHLGRVGLPWEETIKD